MWLNIDISLHFFSMKNFHREADVQRCSVKKVFLNFHKIHRKTPVSAPQACNFIKKETLAQLFSCEFCVISKNTFSNRTPPVAAATIHMLF